MSVIRVISRQSSSKATFVITHNPLLNKDKPSWTQIYRLQTNVLKVASNINFLKIENIESQIELILMLVLININDALWKYKTKTKCRL